MNIPEGNHLRQALKGDADALEHLLRYHGQAVRRCLAGRIPKRWQAVLSDDDVIQQTYADAFTRIGQCVAESERSFANWLITIARRNLNDAIKMLEAEKRGGTRRRITAGGQSGSESHVSLLGLLSGGGPGPSTEIGTEEALRTMAGGIQQLPDDYRRVVEMYDLEQRPVQEVAEALGRSQGAVFMLRSRAHDRLRQLMGSTGKWFTTSS